jgi:hydroxypyruvate isomerase
MERRDFLAQSATLAAGAGAAALAVGTSSPQRAAAQDARAADATAKPFKLKYAPHPGMFKASAGDDYIDELKYVADLGFTAWEDNGMKGRDAALQEKIGKALADLNMTMGIFVCHADFRGDARAFAGRNDDARNRAVEDIRSSVDVAKRTGAKWMTMVCDSFDPRIEWGYQMANCIDLLRRCAEVLEPHELVMVLEPLNWFRDHPGILLHTPAHCYEICRGVDSPACKLLFDVYHTQIQAGNLLPNIDLCWNEIAYVQTGDNPGRNEPGTGEINYRNVFKHIHAKGFTGVVGMEHGVSKRGKEGEDALVAAYRSADDF